MEVEGDMSFDWAIRKDTGFTISTHGNSFNTPSKMCYINNYLWFTTGSTTPMSYYLYKYKTNTADQPLSFDIGSSTRINTPLAVYCMSNEEMYDLRVDD